MRAVICSELNTPVAVEDVRLPPLGATDVRVEIGASGVCHSDLSLIRGWTPYQMPVVLGHEGAGTVVEIGKSVTRCKVGDRVIAAWASACGACWHCIRREGQHCENIPSVFSSHGVIRADGSRVSIMGGLGTFSEQMQVSELSVVPVHTSLPDEQLAMIGCGVTTGAGAALWTAKVPPGSTVAVFGLGGVGLSTLQGARIAGASRIIGIDPVAIKRAMALELGATEVMDPTAGNIVDMVLAATGGRGADFAFEVVGHQVVARQCYDVVRKLGTVVVVGMPHPEAVLSIPLTSVFATEKRIIGSKYGSAQIREHFPMLVEMAERGSLKLAQMISRRIRLEDVNDAFHAIENGDVVRSVIVPQANAA